MKGYDPYHTKKQRKRKGKAKEGKKKYEKAPTTTPGRVERLVQWMMRRARGIADCNHLRLYSQPNCNSGWDSAREKYFNGYHLYMISAADSKHDLPLYPRLQPASQHDAVSLVMSTVDKMLLDAAYDAEAIYLLLEHQSIEPFIG
ncbi:hypothetical protein [Paenibacillus sp. CECT 9249]|uniref:hypothetical protein n=1 Tax=Paenibacillus sp. CECT 9249 TaxID=2845385 RepID=UPI001E4CE9EC|nr:hypothetical protein [Paenibacillus sp. CECT 9249]